MTAPATAKSNPPAPKTEPQVAVAPLNAISPEDVSAGVRKFDQWLRDNTGGYINLERIKTVAGSLPVVGNIIALIDAVMDIITLVSNKAAGFLDWVSLFINLVGIVPIPPTMAAARMSLRPTLHLIRTQLKGAIKDVLVDIIADHLNATLAGTIEKFVEDAKAGLSKLLNDCADKANGMMNDFATGLDKAAAGTLFNTQASADAARKKLAAAQKTSWRDPWSKFGNYFEALHDAEVAMAKAAANAAAAAALSDGIKARLRGIAGEFKVLAPKVKSMVARMGNPGEPGTIAYLLVKLTEAIIKWKKKNKARPAAVPDKKTGETHKRAGPGELEAQSHQSPAKCIPCQAKNKGKVGSKNSIDFAMGTESVSHVDFVLNGVFPLQWSRTYRSNLAAFNDSEQGARWVTPFSTCIDIDREAGELVYHGADGRSHRFPLLQVGQSHKNTIENFTLSQLSDTLIAVTYGKDVVESYERVGQRYRLTMMKQRNGLTLGLRYDHPHGEHGQLSDLLVREGDTVHAHVGVQPDGHGRIAALWEMQDGQPVRQLASYKYNEYGDLVLAQDENGAVWQYQYQHHLLTRYVDRTGRGINLEWDGVNADAKAIHEWADDGSFDTWLQWDKNIRLTYVTDALGQETWYYYDILGYTYRIRYPEGSEEWFFRDDNKNVVKHHHPDGSKDIYEYDERSNLTYHLRPDGTTVHFAWDDDDNLTGIRDPEGNHWLRAYDEQGNVTE
ncbi:YD repeat-containing protein, partial [Andreprevotia lacus DSM 23236]